MLVSGLFLAFRSVLALFICIMFISLCDFFRGVVLQYQLSRTKQIVMASLLSRHSEYLKLFEFSIGLSVN